MEAAIPQAIKLILPDWESSSPEPSKPQNRTGEHIVPFRCLESAICVQSRLRSGKPLLDMDLPPF